MRCVGPGKIQPDRYNRPAFRTWRSSTGMLEEKERATSVERQLMMNDEANIKIFGFVVYCEPTFGQDPGCGALVIPQLYCL